MLITFLHRPPGAERMWMGAGLVLRGEQRGGEAASHAPLGPRGAAGWGSGPGSCSSGRGWVRDGRYVTVVPLSVPSSVVSLSSRSGIRIYDLLGGSTDLRESVTQGGRQPSVSGEV